jgi:hypothetical protein
LKFKKANLREEIEKQVSEVEKGTSKSEEEKIEKLEVLIEKIQSLGKDLSDLNLVFKKIFVKFLSFKDNTDILDSYESSLN